MAEDNSWADRVAGAAKDVWLGVEAAAVIGSSPAGPIHDNFAVTDPVTNAAVSALAESHEALSEAVGARGDADEIADATDVGRQETSSLIVDPPSWLGDEFELDSADDGDLASSLSADEFPALGAGDIGVDTGGGFN